MSDVKRGYLMDAVAVSADAVSATAEYNGSGNGVCVHLLWYGTLVATPILQFSNKPEPGTAVDSPDWVSSAEVFPVNITSGGTSAIPLSTLEHWSGMHARHMRVLIDYTSGSGTVTCIVSGNRG